MIWPVEWWVLLLDTKSVEILSIVRLASAHAFLCSCETWLQLVFALQQETTSNITNTVKNGPQEEQLRQIQDAQLKRILIKHDQRIQTGHK